MVGGKGRAGKQQHLATAPKDFLPAAATAANPSAIVD